MSYYIIDGENKIEGAVNISGSKNSALPILAGTILNGKKTKLVSVPRISDIEIMLKILSCLGCKVERKNDTIIIDSSDIESCEIPYSLMKQMRSSVILVGALLGRHKEAMFSYPGGCEIGARPIDQHLKGFQKLGINIIEDSGRIRCKCGKIKGGKIYLNFPSVGATENLILASIFAEGQTTITNAAMEPEIVDLQSFLNKMGANVTGAGTKTICIKGVKSLNETIYKIMPDRIEAGTFLCAAAITGGNILLKNVVHQHISPVITKLKECGCTIETNDDWIKLEAPKKLKAINIETMPYPGFPTDMQSVFGAMLSIAEGTSIIVENIFENRYKYVNELIKMGANINVMGRKAIINGSKCLIGAEVLSHDLRGGAALVIAGLSANGRTKISNIEHILRGYENFDRKLRNLGARISIKEGEWI